MSRMASLPALRNSETLKNSMFYYMNKTDDLNLIKKAMSFFEHLWNSIFQPGTNPQLLIATHVSYASLILVLVWLCWETRNVHFFALLAIASILWALVTWFTNELKNEPLMDNDQLASDNDAKMEEKQREGNKEKSKKSFRVESRVTGNATVTTSGSLKSRRTRSRKI